MIEQYLLYYTRIDQGQLQLQLILRYLPTNMAGLLDIKRKLKYVCLKLFYSILDGYGGAKAPLLLGIELHKFVFGGSVRL